MNNVKCIKDMLDLLVSIFKKSSDRNKQLFVVSEGNIANDYVSVVGIYSSVELADECIEQRKKKS